ncbi:MAG TPA: tetratricopeptide repeat protein [Kofleriaceae bacterium]|nr:tetratricopeptide repeat protein [Kofleriaceae bacterium]
MKPPKADKIPITTSSEEARKAYLEGRDLAEKLRATDAHERYKEAVARDPSFALAHLGLANTSATAVEFFDELGRAVALADRVSEGERLLIQGTDAGARGDPARQKQLVVQLTRQFPNDERAHNQLGLYYFGVQDWAAAVKTLERAIAINPEFSQPYNQIGYGYRFLEKYDRAEQAFKKYIQLIPNDPNPYDSYAELLMKMGRFDESIANYEKALAIDPNFVASLVGIGNDQMFMGHGADARKTFVRLTKVARNSGEKRQALFWTATSYLHEGDSEKALAEVGKMLAIAMEGQDYGAAAGDHALMGNILLETGNPDAAAAKFSEQLELVARAKSPADTKEQQRRNNLFNRTRVALARGDVAGAKATAKEYAGKVAVKKVPFEVRQTHELAGEIALAEHRYAQAAAELKQANQQDPRVLYQLAVALKGKGDRVAAKRACDRAANFNGLGGNYAFVRQKARDMLAKI